MQLDTYLQSQVVGHKLYQSFGWEDIEYLDTDPDTWDSEMILSVHRVISYAAASKIHGEQIG